VTPGRVAQLLLDATVADPETGCWLWMRSVRSNGYPAFQHKRKNWGAHRLAYHFLVGPLEEGRGVVHHTCGVPMCVNPRHLQLATQVDNLAEMRERQWLLARIAELEAQIATLRSAA
jgi:hypothetical protein